MNDRNDSDPIINFFNDLYDIDKFLNSEPMQKQIKLTSYIVHTREDCLDEVDKFLADENFNFSQAKACQKLVDNVKSKVDVIKTFVSIQSSTNSQFPINMNMLTKYLSSYDRSIENESFCEDFHYQQQVYYEQLKDSSCKTIFRITIPKETREQLAQLFSKNKK